MCKINRGAFNANGERKGNCRERILGADSALQPYMYSALSSVAAQKMGP